MPIKEGAVVEARFWPEPVEIDRMKEYGVYVRILGATTKSRKHIDQMLTHEKFAEISSKIQAMPFTAYSNKDYLYLLFYLPKSPSIPIGGCHAIN